MARFTDDELAKAFVPGTARSFAEVIVELEADRDLKPSRRRDMISGLCRVAAAIGWQVADCPADPVWLRPKIARVLPPAIGIAPNTVDDAALQEFRRALELSEIRKDPAGAAWQVALAIALL